MRIRTIFLCAVMALVLLAAGGCRAKLDKTKVAGLAYDFVMAQVVSLLDRGEFDKSRIPGLAVALSIEFVDTYSEEFPARYRDEVRSFLTSIIPKLIEDYMPGLGDGGGRDDDVRGLAVKMLVEEWNAYEDAK